MLGLIALLGYMAIAAGVKPIVTDGKPDPNTVVPLLFDQMFPGWFAGIAFAAIGIGALVPAAIMSIAAANLWTRNIYKEYLNKDATPAQEARMSKLASLVVKAGAVVVILALDPQFSIDLQLIGGVIILQTLPAIVIGLYSRWAHGWALLAGWAVGLAAGLYMVYDTPNPTSARRTSAAPVRAVELRVRHEGDHLHRLRRARPEPDRGRRRHAAAAQVAVAAAGPDGRGGLPGRGGRSGCGAARPDRGRGGRAGAARGTSSGRGRATALRALLCETVSQFLRLTFLSLVLLT